ncbi:MAG: SHOCT domain-containing protein [bacterium]|nr:SHOCT domain-containing protein [bacterium]
MRGGCLLSTIAIFLDGFFFVFLFAPLLFADTAFAEQSKQFQGALLCGQDTYSVETFKASYHEPGEMGLLFLCTDSNGKETDVTGGFIIIAMVAFIVPFLLIMVLLTRGTSKLAQPTIASQGVVVSVDSQFSPEVHEKLKQFGLGGIVDQFNAIAFDNMPNGDKSLTEQLQEVQDAYDKNLITREEYDQLRQRIINNAVE